MSTPLPLATDPMDVALDTDGDIKIDPKIGLVLISGTAAVAQAVRFRLLSFKGDWFLNTDVGVPYFEDIIGDASKEAGVIDRARAAFGAAILDAPGVLTIQKLLVEIDPQTRAMTVTWQALCSFGDTAGGTVQVPSG